PEVNVDCQLKAAKQARSGLEKVRRELLDPSAQSLERCVAPLQIAIDCMGRVNDALDGVREMHFFEEHALRAEVAGLRHDLLQITALLRSAGSFHEGVGRLLGS